MSCGVAVLFQIRASQQKQPPQLTATQLAVITERKKVLSAAKIRLGRFPSTTSTYSIIAKQRSDRAGGFGHKPGGFC